MVKRGELKKECFLLIVFTLMLGFASADITKENYIVSPDKISLTITTGDLFVDYMKITNLRGSNLQVNFQLSEEVNYLINFESVGLIVEPRNSTHFEYTVRGIRDGEYRGKIILSGDINEEIPVEINVTNSSLNPLFLIDVKPFKRNVNEKGYLDFNIDLNKLKPVDVYNLTLDYLLINSTNDSILLGSEVINLTNSLQLVKQFKLPESVKKGDYILQTTASLDDLHVASKFYFEVTIPFLARKIFGFLPVWVLLLFLFLIILASVCYFLIKRHIEKSKRYHARLDYKTLPKKGARTLWLGKIAETNNLTYLEAERMMTHTIVAGATGGGKSIAAQTIIEEALMKNICVMVFDPTAQWSGMLRKCEDKKMMSFYPNFGLKPTDARGFPGNIRQIKDARQIIEVNRYIEPGHIQIFTLNKLDPNDIDFFIANVIRQVFRSDPKESPELKVLLVFDEVHRLLAKFGGSGEGFLQIERACREFRKWGIGIMLISQVLNDFVGEIKANISTEIQMRTRDEGDLNRIKTKYGEEFLQSLIKASIGAGMFVNPAYNHANPYFVQFRPILHNTRRLSDEELEKYNQYNDTVDDIEYQIEQLETEKIDVFDLKMELKLIKDKIMSGNFSVVDIYLEGLKPRLEKQWQKIGKTPKKKELQLADVNEIKKSIEEAKQQRQKIEEKEKKDAESKKEEEKAKEKIEEKIVKPLTFDNGAMISNLSELRGLLTILDDEVFKIHVNDQKNDIATWLEQFSKDFGDFMRPIKDKVEVSKQIEEFIKNNGAFKKPLVPAKDTKTENQTGQAIAPAAIPENKTADQQEKENVQKK